MDFETGRSKGFAHVQFESVEGAAAAIAMSGSDLMGREVFIDTAKERPPSATTPNANRRGAGPIPTLCHCVAECNVIVGQADEF